MKKILLITTTVCTLGLLSACSEREGNKDSLTGGHGTQENAPFSNIGEETGPGARTGMGDSTHITTDSVIPAGGNNQGTRE